MDVWPPYTGTHTNMYSHIYYTHRHRPLTAIYRHTQNMYSHIYYTQTSTSDLHTHKHVFTYIRYTQLFNKTNENGKQTKNIKKQNKEPT